MKSLIPSKQIFTKVEAHSILGKIIQFPLVRMIIAMLFMFPVMILHQYISQTYLESHMNTQFGLLIYYSEIVVMCFLLFLTYKAYTKLIEKRFALEVSTKDSFKEILSGLLLGAGLICFMVILFIISSCMSFEGFNDPSILLNKTFLFGIQSLNEEFLFTIIIFKLLEEAFGSWTALLINALLFGFAHIMNDNATIWSSFAIALCNPMIVISFMITRRIWMSWGLHFSWNFTLSAVFSIPVSGLHQTGYFQTSFSGPEWFTGGAFGVEASYVAVAINFAIGLFLLFIAIRNDQIVLPIWIRKKRQ